MKNDSKKSILYIVYSFIVLVFFVSLIGLGNFKTFQDFSENVEKSLFDLRQKFSSTYKKPNKEIAILALDDATYEYIMDKHGSWPISRKVWSDVIEFTQLSPVKAMVFDLLFLKPNLKDVASDRALVNTIKKYDNVYLSMNFDNYDDRVRQSPELDEKFQLKIKDGGLYDNDYISFVNARVVMQEISSITENIGIINITRDNDGIIRNTAPIFKYKNEYYPNLSFKLALDILGVDSVEVVNNVITIDKKHKIPLDSTQRAILNWYGKSKTYTHYPLWELIEAQKNNDIKYLDNFKNKILYVGTTATSLGDIKSVPTEFQLAGVELHTTFLNNIFDNNFIKRTSVKVDFLISIILSIIVGYCVLKTPSVIKTFVFLILSLMSYWIFANIVMLAFNLWVPVVLPFVSMIIIFILTYCEKYLLKVKDYEQTYKLAVTDGLTTLYNHRYFQEQMILGVSNYNRYNIPFSLILIDIDFFKKFNDQYGHQSGDCVLKQVAYILKKISRTSDVVCRYGGEEMAIILTNTKKEDAILSAKKICATVNNAKFTLVNGEKVHVTISVGVASVNINGNTSQEIIEYADKCLYKAKEQGRNQVVYEV